MTFAAVFLLWTLFVVEALAFAPHVPLARLAKPLHADFFGNDSIEDTEDKGEKQDGRLSTEELESTAPEWGGHVPKFSHITLVGRVGNNPDPRYFDNGKVVLNLSLAVRRKYHPLERRALKIQEDATDWFSLELWGRDAEYASKYVTKGARVGVSGSLSVDSWADKMTGEKRSKCTVIVKDLDILESKAEADLRRGNIQGGSQQGGYQQGGNQQGGYQQGGNQQSGNQQGDSPRKSFFTQDDEDEDDGPSSAGTGGFFDN